MFVTKKNGPGVTETFTLRCHVTLDKSLNFSASWRLPIPEMEAVISILTPWAGKAHDPVGSCWDVSRYRYWGRNLQNGALGGRRGDVTIRRGLGLSNRDQRAELLPALSLGQVLGIRRMFSRTSLPPAPQEAIPIPPGPSPRPRFGIKPPPGGASAAPLPVLPRTHCRGSASAGIPLLSGSRG